MGRINAAGCRRFARTYLKTMDPEAAARAAGLPDGMQALSQPEIREAVTQQRALLRQQLLPEDVTRRLAELAFGRANDCVRLALEPEPDIENLDLSLLAEVKRSEKGTVEVKLVDRLRVLDRLAELTDSGREADDFYAALNGLCGHE